MKFRNPKTGEIYDIGDGERGVMGTGFCGDKHCEICPVGEVNKRELCSKWAVEHPHTAARLMGYEVVEDDPQRIASITIKVSPELMGSGGTGCEPVKPFSQEYQEYREQQEAKADGGKPRPTLVPPSLMEAVTAIREYGCSKYHDPDNWKRVEPQRYRDAAYRHWLAYLKDPHSVDEESGLPHLWHLACNVSFLIELENKP